MNTSLTMFLLFSVAVLATVVAIYFWRLSTSYMTILTEGANRYEELRKALRQAEESYQRTKRTLDEHRNTEKQMAGSLRDRNEKLSEVEKQLELKQAELQHKTNSLELQKNHLMN